jgi:hypothetical protein
MVGAEQILSVSTGGLKKMNRTIMSIWLLIISLLVILNKDLTDYYIGYHKLFKRLRKSFNKIISVTSRHVRPFISLAEKMLQFAKKIRNASFLVLKVAKLFPGS